MDAETPVPPQMVSFSVLSPAGPVRAPRVGKIAFAASGRTLATPHYIPLTSRGAVPHIAHDVLRDQTTLGSLYTGLEDFIEKEKKHPAPVYTTPVAAHESKLKKFNCLPDDMPVILGPRRFPAIPCPPPNTETSISVLTTVGFRQLSAHQYVEAVQKLRPDIAIGMADIVLGQPPGVKRRGKMVDRTHSFTRDALERLYNATEGEKSKVAYFAPVLPLENAQQSLYLDDLETEFRDHLSGLALYESASLTLIPESLGSLPRLLFSAPSSPHEVLQAISLGADLLTIPFMGTCSDSGTALDFGFPISSVPQDRGAEPQPLALNLWSRNYATDTGALRDGCGCYTCRKHHRAYVHHLLSAKEMTAWSLLQIHNHHVMDTFFAGVRESIQRGSFEDDVQAFNRTRALSLPESTGQGPRLRGHQLPAAGPHQPRRMPRIWGRLDDAIQKFAESQSSIATPDTDADGLERHGFADKL